mmetsp:Transcript_46062/g.98670  ORF Transcript_46062/g.98670 Transcript_46062/m.98670 type:complete len:230 (+) Transcript_46062:195-884(+)
MTSSSSSSRPSSMISSLTSAFTGCNIAFAAMIPGPTSSLITTSLLGSTLIVGPGGATPAVEAVCEAALFSSLFLRALMAFVSIGDSPRSLSSFTINFTRSWAAFEPSTIRVRFPATALDVSFSACAKEARSMAFRCSSIFFVSGPSGILMRICSAGPSEALKIAKVSSETTKLSSRMVHSPVAIRFLASCSAFLVARSFPIIFKVVPLSRHSAPLAIRRSSMCFQSSCT